MASIRLIDVAKLAGVSKATASRALAHSPLVTEETRKKVLDVAEKLRYKPNALAQAVATKKSGILGFLIYHRALPYFGHTFFGPVLDGALEEAAAHGYHIVLARAQEEAQSTFDEHFIQDSIEGAMLISFDPKPAIEEFERRQIPLVLINDQVTTPHNSFILDSNYDGAMTLMRHLLVERGYRSVAILSDRLNHPSYMQRYLAYLDAHAETGVPVYKNSKISIKQLDYDPSRAVNYAVAEQGLTEFPLPGTPIVVRNGTAAAGEEAARKLLAAGNLPRALFATTDSLALGAMKAFREAGLRIPEDIAVAGYDDIDAAYTAEPPLTTVHVDRNAIGRAAVTELLRRIKNPDLPARSVYIPNKLVVRRST